MPELPYYASRESTQYGNRIPNLVTGEWGSAHSHLSSKSANTLEPQTTTEAESSANSGSTNSLGDSNGAKTHFPHLEKVSSQPPTPVNSQNTLYPGCIHIRAISDTVSLWHPEPQKRENINGVPNAQKSPPKTPGSQVPSCLGYYQQLGCIPIADDTRPNTILYWNTKSSEGEHTYPTLNAKNQPPTTPKENRHLSFSPSTSPTTSDRHTSPSPICPSCSTSPTSPTSPRRTRLRAQLASACQQRKSLDCDIARLSKALGIEDPHDFGQRAALQEHLKSQLQVIERQKERLVAKGERTEELDKEIEVLRGALGEIDGDERDGKRRETNEGILMGRIVKREVLEEPKRER